MPEWPILAAGLAIAASIGVAWWLGGWWWMLPLGVAVVEFVVAVAGMLFIKSLS